jgi:hypothetical protein
MSATKVPMRRRPHQHQEEDDDIPIPLDEDEQTKIVEELEAQMAASQQQIRTIFRVVCHIASVLCLASALLVQQLTYQNNDTPNHQRPLLAMVWAHTAVSALLHSFIPFSIVRVHNTTTATPKLAVKLSGSNRLYATVLIISLFLAAIFIGNIRSTNNKKNSTETAIGDRMILLHQCLAIGNIVLSMVAVYLKYDMDQVGKEMHGLQESKYRYKSL